MPTPATKFVKLLTVFDLDLQLFDIVDHRY